MSNGWYVETLLRNREIIKTNITTKEFVKIKTNSRELKDDPEILYDIGFDEENFGFLTEVSDFYNDDYNNLLLVENKLKELIENKQLSTEEANVTIGILQHKSLKELGKELNIKDRRTLIDIFRRVCTRLEFILGGDFSDEGYLDYMAEKYNLSESEIQKARDYMNSNKIYFLTQQKG